MKTRFRKSAICTAIAMAYGVAIPAGAQTAPPPPAPAASADAAETSEEVIVTARRIEERAQDVPISMTIFNQKQLTDHNVATAVDLAAYTPSLATNSEFGSDNSSFAIRGFRQEIDTTASVAVYFADVVAPRGGTAGIDAGDGAGPGSFFDLQNVQVLKGPQGTLFGRNTDGGAILLVPQKPTAQMESSIDASYGNRDMWRIQGIFNLPVSANFRMRFGIDHEDRDGYLTNLSDVGPSKFSDVGYTAARASAVWNITPNLENYTIVSYANSSHNGNGSKLLACNNNPNPQESALGSFACAQMARDAGRGFWTVENDLSFAKSQMQQAQVINSTTWAQSDSLTIKNIASYAQLTNTLNNDLFGTNFATPAYYPAPFGNVPFFFTNVVTAPGHKANNESSVTEEIRLQGNLLDNRLVWQGGVYGEDNEPLSGSGSGETSGTTISCTNILALQCTDILGTLAGFPGSAGSVNYQVGTVRYHDLGLYEQSSFSITDALKVTEGLRYTMDSSSANFIEGAYRFPQPNTPEFYCTATTSPYNYETTHATAPTMDACAIRLKQDSYAPTWTLGLDYKVTADILAYAKYSRGYRQGSVSPTAPEDFQTFNPEKVDSFELGTKTSFDTSLLRGTFNVDVFYNNFRDQQISEGFECAASNPECGATPNIGIVNAGRSRIYGMEVESVISPFKGLTINTSYAYVNATLVSLTPPALPAGSPYQNFPTTDVGGNLPLTPKNKITSSVTYVLPLSSPTLGRLSGSAGYSYQSGMIQSSYTATPYYKSQGYGLFSLNADWTAIKGSRFDAGFFATNLFDQRYVNYITGIYNGTGFEAGQVGEPRMVGGRVRMNFGG